MKIGTRARYSLRLMMAVARLATGDEPVPLDTAARHCGLSSRYLGQLVPPLKHARLLRGRTGRGGGYLLGRSPAEIRVREIVEVAMGPIVIVDCVVDESDCMHTEFCTCRGLWALVNRRIVKSLDEFTLADLLSDDLTKRIAMEMAEL